MTPIPASTPGSTNISANAMAVRRRRAHNCRSVLAAERGIGHHLRRGDSAWVGNANLLHTACLGGRVPPDRGLARVQPQRAVGHGAGMDWRFVSRGDRREREETRARPRTRGTRQRIAPVGRTHNRHAALGDRGRRPRERRCADLSAESEPSTTRSWARVLARP